MTRMYIYNRSLCSRYTYTFIINHCIHEINYNFFIRTAVKKRERPNKIITATKATILNTVASLFKTKDKNQTRKPPNM